MESICASLLPPQCPASLSPSPSPMSSPSPHYNQQTTIRVKFPDVQFRCCLDVQFRCRSTFFVFDAAPFSVTHADSNKQPLPLPSPMDYSSPRRQGTAFYSSAPPPNLFARPIAICLMRG